MREVTRGLNMKAIVVTRTADYPTRGRVPCHVWVWVDENGEPGRAIAGLSPVPLSGRGATMAARRKDDAEPGPCRRCGEPVPPGRRTWCSEACRRRKHKRTMPTSPPEPPTPPDPQELLTRAHTVDILRTMAEKPVTVAELPSSIPERSAYRCIRHLVAAGLVRKVRRVHTDDINGRRHWSWEYRLTKKAATFDHVYEHP